MKIKLFSVLIIGVMFFMASCLDDDALTPGKVKVSLNESSLALLIGESDTLVVTILPDAVPDKTVMWSSSDTSVVTVDESGKVTAVKVGEATITVTTLFGERTAACAVKVDSVVKVSSVVLNRSSLKLLVGKSDTLVATILPDNAFDKAVVWSSSDTSVVMVNESGKLTAEKIGKATITVSTVEGNKIASCLVEVEFISFVNVPAGNFRMGYNARVPGDWDWDEGTRHQVTLTKGFEISPYEVTNEQYCSFLNMNGIGRDGIWEGARTYKTEVLIYDSSDGRTVWGVRWDSGENKWTPVPGKENCPVIYVTWFGAKEFAMWVGGDLPTEAQWEYACRGDRDTLLFGVGTGKELDVTMANIIRDGMPANSNTTCAVGKYRPNFYGIYDMHGNIGEWCNDWYAANYGSVNATDTATDPVGPATGISRVARGGCWGSEAWGCHSASRYYFAPEGTYDEVGFRVVRN